MKRESWGNMKVKKNTKRAIPCYSWLRRNGYSGLGRCIRTYPYLFRHMLQDKHVKSKEEWLQIAKELAKLKGGTLPYYAWLRDNGYNSLAAMMIKYPDFFSHIPQENKRGKSKKEWVRIAEDLAQNNNNILPNPAWLQKNSFSALHGVMKKYPDEFSHIEQESKKGRTVDEWISKADLLASKNGGTLPNHAWLIANGYSGLPWMLKKHPDQFSHLKQDKLLYSVTEQAEIVERLIKENSGILPSYSWLCKNGYVALVSTLRKYPDKFSNVRQEKLRITIGEHIKTAKKLAKENGGVLPSQAWLNKNGYEKLSQVYRRYTNRFPQLVQQKLQRTIDEWVSIADKLAEENEGVLPCGSWLKEHKYSGINQCMRINSDKFSHLQQEFRGSGGRIMGVRAIGK